MDKGLIDRLLTQHTNRQPIDRSNQSMVSTGAGRPRTQSGHGQAMEGPADDPAAGGNGSSKDTSATAATDAPAASAAVGNGDEEEEEQDQGGHPYGVKPWGNFLTDGGGGQEVVGGGMVCQ
jgi:hypothetical protein